MIEPTFNPLYFYVGLYEEENKKRIWTENDFIKSDIANFYPIHNSKQEKHWIDKIFDTLLGIAAGFVRR